jgi:hypothetical protein
MQKGARTAVTDTEGRLCRVRKECPVQVLPDGGAALQKDWGETWVKRFGRVEGGQE